VARKAERRKRGRRRRRRLRPDLWVSWRPNGIGLTKPNHYGEMLKTVAENKGNLRYAWRILRKGVCDGCALGVAGLHDWTLDGVHLCTTRLNLLKVNTMPAMAEDALADVATLRDRTGAQLRDLGRLAHPMLRRSGEPGFTRISWDQALDLVADSALDRADRVKVFDLASNMVYILYYSILSYDK
jgi:anaerobic selenocysteine-containing dehydrogenase